VTVTPPDELPVPKHGPPRPSDPREVLRSAYRRIFTYFCTRVSEGDAHVLTQETFLRLSVWQNGDSARTPRPSLVIFLYKNARWVYVDHIRKLARTSKEETLTGGTSEFAALENERRLLLGSKLLPPELADAAYSEALEQAVAKLSERQLEALVSRYVDDLTTTQISDMIGVTPRAVNDMISRALSSLSVDQGLAVYAPRGGHR
jgi:RNA polymerase sigma factor (sigma-70 family)